VFDSSKDVLAYHDEKVTLSQNDRSEMRKRRDANRDRLKTRLKDAGKPVPQEFIKQGSYAMLTMVQDPNNDYDIDDGVYFTQESLKKDDGSDMSPTEVKQMVCDMLQDDRFDKRPKVMKSCVRIFYEAGYHVDMPVYRIRTSDGKYELASDDGWTVSRAADTEDWFNTTNKNKSPDLGTNGGQFRRNVRLLKKFARSRREWQDDITSGFTITKLAEECFTANIAREDMALRDCMQRIHNRLLNDLQVKHPVTPGAMLTSGPNDTGTKLFRDKLKEALDSLQILDKASCTAEQAAKAWDKVFNTDFFSVRQAAASKAAMTQHNTSVVSHS
jgi:predicted PolB exonuclease-like 3'-5' exonuclease